MKTTIYQELKELIGYKLEEIEPTEGDLSLYFRKGKETAVIYTNVDAEVISVVFNP